MCNINPITCDGGNVIKIICNTEKKQIGIGFLDSSKAQITISDSIKNNTK